jgi:hypothetical protein
MAVSSVWMSMVRLEDCGRSYMVFLTEGSFHSVCAHHVRQHGTEHSAFGNFLAK